MAFQDPKQPEIEASGQDLYENEPTLPDWRVFHFSDFHSPDDNLVDQHLLLASGFLSPEDRSDLDSLIEPSPGPSDDLGDELHDHQAAEFSDDLGDELRDHQAAEFSDDLGDELHGQSATGPFDQAMTSSCPDCFHLEETSEDWIHTLMGMICQMMFVSGETSEASVETTTIIEEIVHTQVTEIVGLEFSL